MANRRRDPAREVFWRKTVRRCAASGLSVHAFCRRERLTESALYAWRRTIAERDGMVRGRPSFMPAVVVEAPQVGGSIGGQGVTRRAKRLWRGGADIAGRGGACETTPQYLAHEAKLPSRGDASIAIELADGCVLWLAGPNATEQLADLVIALQSRCRR